MRQEVLNYLANLRAPRYRAGWTEEREQLLKTLWLQGLTASQIAKRLGGVTRNAVIGKRIRLGLPDRAVYARGPVKKKPNTYGGAVTAARKRGTAAPKVTHEEPKLRGARKGPNAVRFMERREGKQCPMFCEGEDGPTGFVCGERVEIGSWCSSCFSRVFDLRKKAAA